MLYSGRTKGIRNETRKVFSEDSTMTHKYITVNALAKRLGRSPGTVRNDVWARRIPFVRILGSIRFDWDEVQRWIAQQNKGNGPCDKEHGT